MRTSTMDDFGDVFDSREVEERIDDLEGTRQTLVDAVEECEQDHADDVQALQAAREALAEWDASDDAEELSKLRAFRDDVSSPEWSYGLTLIRESYWEEYCEELVKDIGDLPNGIPNYIVIDWTATAQNLAQDYSTAELDGDTIYYRSC